MAYQATDEDIAARQDVVSYCIEQLALANHGMDEPYEHLSEYVADLRAAGGAEEADYYAGLNDLQNQAKHDFDGPYK